MTDLVNQDVNARASDGHKLEDSISAEIKVKHAVLTFKKTKSDTKALRQFFFFLQLMKQENKKTMPAQELDKQLSRFLYY